MLRFHSDKSHCEAIKQLMPIAVEDDVFENDVAIEGDAFDTLLSRADDLYVQMFVANMDSDHFDLLRNYERMLAIVPAVGASTVQRINTVSSKLAESGSLTIEYFVGLIERMGVEVVAYEKIIPFMSGIAECGDCLNEDPTYLWEVYVASDNDDVRKMLNRLNPAHAGVIITIVE